MEMTPERPGVQERVINNAARVLAGLATAWVAAWTLPLLIFGRARLDEWLTPRVGFVQSAEWLDRVPEAAGFGVFAALLGWLVFARAVRLWHPSR